METKDTAESTRLGSKRELCLERRRERILAVVEDGDLPLSVSDLTDLVTDQSWGSDDDPAKLRVRLHHVHLPKLDELGVLQYDESQNAVVGCSGLEE